MDKPLTIKELRQMHGKPVWVVPHGIQKSYWAIIEVGTNYVRANGLYDGHISHYYGNEGPYSWLAYRNKKED